MAQKKNNHVWIIFIVITVVAFALLLTGVFVWRNIKSSPKYALYRMYQSIHQSDFQTFSQYINLDMVIDNILNQSSEDLSGLKELSKMLLKRQVENGLFFGSGWIKTENLTDGIRFWRMTDVSVINRLTLASIRKGNNLKLDFTMAKKEGSWQVIRIDLEIHQVLGLLKDRSGTVKLTEDEYKQLEYFELKVKGFLAIREDKLTEGIKALEYVLSVKKDKAIEQYLDDAYFERGEYFYSIGEIEKALEDLNRCSKKNAKAQFLLTKIKTKK